MDCLKAKTTKIRPTDLVHIYSKLSTVSFLLTYFYCSLNLFVVRSTMVYWLVHGNPVVYLEETLNSAAETDVNRLLGNAPCCKHVKPFFPRFYFKSTRRGLRLSSRRATEKSELSAFSWLFSISTLAFLSITHAKIPSFTHEFNVKTQKTVERLFRSTKQLQKITLTSKTFLARG